MEKWVGKIALVTGASSGIGAAIAEELLKHGVNVVGCSEDNEKLKEVTAKFENKKGKFYSVLCDLRKEEDILSMFKFIKEKLKTVHICINNAGLVNNANLSEGSTEVILIAKHKWAYEYFVLTKKRVVADFFYFCCCTTAISQSSLEKPGLKSKSCQKKDCDPQFSSKTFGTKNN